MCLSPNYHQYHALRLKSDQGRLNSEPRPHAEHHSPKSATSVLVTGSPAQLKHDMLARSQRVLFDANPSFGSLI
jgi:hypothetical protein